VGSKGLNFTWAFVSNLENFFLGAVVWGQGASGAAYYLRSFIRLVSGKYLNRLLFNSALLLRRMLAFSLVWFYSY